MNGDSPEQESLRTEENQSIPEPYAALGRELAFPRQATAVTNGALGLTKRELFAAMIMQGLAANSIPGGHHAAERQASEAVKKADALLKELSK